MLSPERGGSDAAPVTYSFYGTGQAPVISAQDVLAAWTESSEGQLQSSGPNSVPPRVYRTSGITYPVTRLWRNNVLLELPRPDVASLQKDGDWTYDATGKALYFYSNGDINKSQVESTIRQDALRIKSQSHLLFQGLVFSGGYDFAAFLDAATDVKFVNCVFRDADSSGLIIQNGSHNISVRSGSVRDNGYVSTGDNDGIGIGGMGGGSSNLVFRGIAILRNKRANIEIATTNTNAAISHVLIQGCKISASSGNGFKIGGGHSDIRLVRNRIVQNAGYGIVTNQGTSGDPEVEIQNNKIHDNGAGEPDRGNIVIGSRGVTFEANTVITKAGFEIKAVFPFTADYNTYSPGTGDRLIDYVGVSFKTLDGYQIASGQDQHSTEAVPSP